MYNCLSLSISLRESFKGIRELMNMLELEREEQSFVMNFYRKRNMQSCQEIRVIEQLKLLLMTSISAKNQRETLMLLTKHENIKPLT